MDEALMRIGELSRAVGVSADVLRAWERRYGVFAPQRTAGKFRMYTAGDLDRVRRMKRLVDSGVPAAEAARRVIMGEPAAEAAVREPGELGAARLELRRVLRTFDDAGAQAAIDQLLAAYGLETLITEVLLPELRTIGDEWASGEATVGQEHFAANLLRGRLLALGRGWDRGIGPRLVLACPEGEEHDISLVMFGLLARQRGWRITFIGANTPFESLAATVRALSADSAIVYATSPAPLRAVLSGLESLSPAVVYLAGPGALGAETALPLLEDRLVGAADRITADWRERRMAEG